MASALRALAKEEGARTKTEAKRLLREVHALDREYVERLEREI